MRCRNEPKCPGGHQRQTDDDGTFVTEPPRQDAGRNGHEKVTHVVGELYKRRLHFADVQRVLKMLLDGLLKHP